jgi:hypothetical protein
MGYYDDHVAVAEAQAADPFNGLPSPGVTVESFRFNPFRDGVYEGVTLRWGDGRRVQVHVSPHGRSVSVHVDGEKWGKQTSE